MKRQALDVDFFWRVSAITVFPVKAQLAKVGLNMIYGLDGAEFHISSPTDIHLGVIPNVPQPV